ncbi:MAG: 1-(5-phosphoribosyl)-5-[Kiritimatiellae bacterium]|nr:1-(5-phosphoribosyl)-5-[(5-phosphoribosylamino)methylideneamino]imidazole-4-carboxamide isomerase [Kiritimatiellia bacterium]
MTIIPAIDLKGGKCVRLRQGVADDATVYGDDPVAMARHWEAEGGRALHVVDLDGAFNGAPAHAEVVAKIAAALSIPVEIGGGLRNDDHVRAMLDAGVSRVILGTRALAEEAALKRLVDLYGGAKIAVGIDARGGLVQVKCWVETTGTRATDLAKRVSDLGVGTIIYTDTATDGMLSGPNLEAMDKICEAASCGIVASGGISSVKNVRDLVALGRHNLVGAIVGKALYEGRVTVAEMQAEAGA